jgi:hypothetical protein
MSVLVSRQQAKLSSGTVARIPGIWEDYCELRDSRGDGSIPRIKYQNGEILLMIPHFPHRHWNYQKSL